jgi:hypothetical protein
MRGERGQASIEWTGVVLLVCLALAGAVAAVGPNVDGRSFGGFLAHRIVCAVRGGCADAALARAYGKDRAALVREHAPDIVYEPGEAQLPVDWRRCRSRRCADGPPDRDADVHRSHAGERATVFTRVVERGGGLYLQYWLYYPDSNTTLAHSDSLWKAAWALQRLHAPMRDPPGYPGFHRDDWEAYVVRLDGDGRVWVRASSHGHWQGCKQRTCRNRWIGSTGWTRVSRGSHAGHIPVEIERGARRPRSANPGGRPLLMRPRLPGRDMRERTTTAEALRLIPLERVERESYRALDEDVLPPWRKEAYMDPEEGRP